MNARCAGGCGWWRLQDSGRIDIETLQIERKPIVQISIAERAYTRVRGGGKILA
jgi:hypothetical protein